MKKSIVILLTPALCLLLVMPPVVQASGCVTCLPRRKVVKVVKVVRRVVVKERTFLVPQYAVTYAPIVQPAAIVINPPPITFSPPIVNYTPAVAAYAAVGVKAVAPVARAAPMTCEERLDRMERMFTECMKKLEAGGGGRNNGGGGDVKVTALLNKKCAACHEAKVAEKSGGDFILFDGKELIPPKGAQLDLLLGKVIRGAMPKLPNPHGITALTENEIADIADWVDAQGKAKPKAKKKEDQEEVPEKEEKEKQGKKDRVKAYLARKGQR